MKQINKIILVVLLFWLFIAAFSSFIIYKETSQDEAKSYKVEMNRISDLLNKGIPVTEIAVNRYQYVKKLDYIESTKSETEFDEFFHGKGLPNAYSYTIIPYRTKGTLNGFVRISYILHDLINIKKIIIIVNACLVGFVLFIISILIYIKQVILKPFHEIVDMPYQLSKGHFKVGLKESKYRFFGKFIWGLDLLRESLDAHKRKELELQKEKKTMILSISHDIKTPLSAIKLYSKAIYDNLYTTDDKRKEAARLIDEKATQIEGFVNDIIANSREDFIQITVLSGEFYLSSLVELIKKSYVEKLALLKLVFVIDKYDDVLLKGDIDKLMEVFENLIENALKYGDGKKIHISFSDEDYCKLIKVSNTGTPIPSTEFVHLFESFWRGSNARDIKGSGLGLYICKQILKKMDGDIFVESSENTMDFTVVVRYC
ncbi:MAG: hypothetical protein K0S41_4105 [Anaerocolumna sp.]|jgi:signal transduction histidine kinase|nr:hypothetical protein [Anaerocolumna sp.]